MKRCVLALLLAWTQAVQAVGLYEMPANQIPFPHLVPASAFGKVVDARRAESGEQPRVILIEDLHGHLGVQKNIAQLLYDLVPRLNHQSGSAVAVFVEGAWTPIDSTPISSIPEASVREITANYLLSKAEMSGAEYFAVLHPELAPAFRLQGAEDPTLSRAHIELFQKTAPQRQALLIKILNAEKDLEPLRARYYSSALVHLQKLRLDFQNETITSARYAATLLTWARQQKIDTRRYRYLGRARNFYPALNDSAHEQQIAFELSSLHFQIARSLCANKPWSAHIRSEDARAPILRHNLVMVDQYLDLLKRILSEQLTRDEVGVVYRALPQLTEVVRRIIGGKALPQLSEILTASLDFYPLAVMRDNPLLENSLKTEGANTVVLIAGGFHAQGIIDSLRRKNLSYMVVVPVIARPITAEEQMNYARRAAGDHFPLIADDRTVLAQAAAGK